MGQQKAVRTKLAFVTTSLGTKWESYSQALIARSYPDANRLVIDGTRNWSPLGFLDRALEEDSDYTVHVDEDCFLYDSAPLDALISYMEANGDVVLAGVPDGGHYYREHNPYACNLFFMVFKTATLRSLWRENPNWKDLKFQESFREESNIDLDTLDQSRIRYDDFEPYYGFFWMILGSGKRIHYLNSSLDPEILSTDVSFDGWPQPFARHMWYLRSWDNQHLGTYDKVPNYQRYLSIEKEILAIFGKDKSFRRLLRSLNRLRILKRATRRFWRVLDRLR